MEAVAELDAKTRLSELLERIQKGESFIITKHGNPVARLIPERSAGRERALAAAERLKQLRGVARGATLRELLDAVHEGHRY